MRLRDEACMSLPAFEIAGRVSSLLSGRGCVVVTAPPGAGKSTLLPLTILQGLRDGGKVLMLEPRRIAARQVAERMAWLLGEKVGETVGYRIRFESRVSATTRIEVLTEGILSRMLIDDPALEGVSVVIFDEFHERGIVLDEALALTREARSVLRPDLGIVVMSATIDAARLCEALDAPLVESAGKMFPVEIIRTAEEADAANCAALVARTVLQAHRGLEGDILAFLPGEAEIRRCCEMLAGELGDTHICPLYGMLPFEEQRMAIAPSAPGERKVVLATPIAETSITIEGVRVVVDSGLCRKMVYDPQTGLSRLETVRISLDMATQRSGRAGRVAPGVCYRLWSLGTEQRMQPNRTPEILEADLAPLVLDVAAWGGSAVGDMQWIDTPPAAAVARAEALLGSLGALERGSVTPHGRALAKMPCHPRIAQMLTASGSAGLRPLAADIAALLEEKDPMPSAGTDLCERICSLREARRRGSPGRAFSRIVRNASQYAHIAGVRVSDDQPDPYDVGLLVASAWPERVAKLRGEGCGRYILSSGEPAAMDDADPMSGHEWLAVASLNARQGGEGKIFLAAPVDPLRLRLRERDNVFWDSRKGCVTARHERNAGCLLVDSRPISDLPREAVAAVMAEAARKSGLSMFEFSDEVQNLQRRIAAVASWHPEMELPDVTTDAVLSRAGEWLPLFGPGASSVAELRKIDMSAVVWSMLGYQQQNDVDRLAPSHIEVPTGSRIRVEYRLGADAPVLRVRLQECFGMEDTPRVDAGRRPVLMELLSPGFKPVQLTQDLGSFWKGTYFDVRKELRRRYPKHYWPDNPLEAEATRGVKRK